MRPLFFALSTEGTPGLLRRISPHGWRSAFSTRTREDTGFDAELIDLSLDHVHAVTWPSPTTAARDFAKRVALMAWRGDALECAEAGRPVPFLTRQDVNHSNPREPGPLSPVGRALEPLRARHSVKQGVARLSASPSILSVLGNRCRHARRRTGGPDSASVCAVLPRLSSSPRRPSRRARPSARTRGAAEARPPSAWVARPCPIGPSYFHPRCFCSRRLASRRGGLRRFGFLRLGSPCLGLGGGRPVCFGLGRVASGGLGSGGLDLAGFGARRRFGLRGFGLGDIGAGGFCLRQPSKHPPSRRPAVPTRLSPLLPLPHLPSRRRVRTASALAASALARSALRCIRLCRIGLCCFSASLLRPRPASTLRGFGLR